MITLLHPADNPLPIKRLILVMIATKGASQKSKRLTPGAKLRFKTKANDYPVLLSTFSTELCRFLLKTALADEIIATPCANVIVNAQFH